MSQIESLLVIRGKDNKGREYWEVIEDDGSDEGGAYLAKVWDRRLFDEICKGKTTTEV